MALWRKAISDRILGPQESFCWKSAFSYSKLKHDTFYLVDLNTYERPLAAESSFTSKLCRLDWSTESSCRNLLSGVLWLVEPTASISFDFFIPLLLNMWSVLSYIVTQKQPLLLMQSGLMRHVLYIKNTRFDHWLLDSIMNSPFFLIRLRCT